MGRTFTAEELAARARGELGADVTPRTIYFYRQVGVLSPLEVAGSQARFTDRHFLELAAVLALRRAPDRPTLAEIAAMLRGLPEEVLRDIARTVGPTARELVASRPERDGWPVAESHGSLMLHESLPPGSPGSPASAGAPASGMLSSPAAASSPDSAAPSPGTTAASPADPSPGVTINLAPGITLHVGPEASRELVTRLIGVSLDHARGRKREPGPIKGKKDEDTTNGGTNS